MLAYEQARCGETMTSRYVQPAKLLLRALGLSFAANLLGPGPGLGQGAPRPAGRPASPSAVQVDTLHGVVMADPYRWLEDSESPAVRSWIREQDRIARQRLAALPSRAEMHALVSKTASTESYLAPVKENGKYFITRIIAVGPQRGITLLVRDSATGITRTVIDEAVQRRAGLPARQAVPAPSAEQVAYGVGSDATEWQTVRVRSVATGQELADSVEGLHRFAPSVSWARDPGRAGFYYTRFPRPGGGSGSGRPVESGRVYYHRVGDPQSADQLVFSVADSSVLTPTAVVTDDGRYLVITVRRGTAQASSIHVQDLSDSAGRARPPRPLIQRDGSNYIFLGNDGPVFWIATDNNAPRGRVIAVDAAAPAPEHRRELVPEGPDAIDTWNFGAAVGGNLIVLYRRDAVLVGKIFGRDGSFRHDLEIPGRGSIWTGIVGKTTDSEALFTVQGVADPGTVYRLDARKGQTTAFLRSALPYDASQLVTEQVFFRGRDGARIPMYVVRRRDIPLDGSAPLWIYGYGAQRWAAAPWFQPPVAAWLLGGGVWAVPNIRGGAEYGEDWYQAGARRNKQTGIDDYLAAVEWLIANKYTAAGRVVAHTSSAGGVLVAAAVVQRPALFGATVMEYPVLDMLRYEHLLTGNRWTEDYGTIKDSADFRAMLGYSPIQNLRPGGCYPPALLTPGEHDQTAAPAHAYKLAAALQAAQGCGDRPVLLRVSWGTGHSAGATLADAIENWVDQLTFARNALRAEAPTAGALPEVQKRGSTGPVLLLIPCFSCRWRSFETFMERNADKYSMFAVTLPGMGGTARPMLPVDPDSAVWRENALAALSRLLDQERLHDVTVVGHSFGATFALELAARRSDVITRLVNVDGALTSDRGWFPERAEERIIKAREIAERQSRLFADPDYWLRFNATTQLCSRDRALLYHGMFASTDRRVVVQYWRENVLRDLNPSLRRLRIPVLDLHAIGARVANVDSARTAYLTMMKTNGAPATARTVFLHRTSHFVHEHRPVLFDSLIAEFVTARGNPSGPSDVIPAPGDEGTCPASAQP